LLSFTCGKQVEAAAAQLRAQLGLPPGVSANEASLILQAQHVQRQQHDMQLRQMLLHEQYGQHFEDPRFRALSGSFGEQIHNPHYHDQYHNLLLNEQLQQQQRAEQDQAFLRAQQRASSQSKQSDLVHSDQVHLLEGIRRQQLGFRPEDMAQPSSQQSFANNIFGNPLALLLQRASSLQTQTHVPTSPHPARSTSPHESADVVKSPLQILGPPAPKKSSTKKNKRSANHGDIERPCKKKEVPSPSMLSEERADVLAYVTDPLQAVAIAAEIAISDSPIKPKGDFVDLLQAAYEEDKADIAANVLSHFKETIHDVDLQEMEVVSGGVLVPALPIEPIWDIPEERAPVKPRTSSDASMDGQIADVALVNEGKAKPMAAAELEYQPNVDVWWPSTAAVKRERQQEGESSDEDNFEEHVDAADVCLRYRANEQVIRDRLATQLQPGVLEKIPHCRIHRVRNKSNKNPNTNAPELVYCWQVTEIYPKDIMVNCSECGTWRHAACGGHWKPYSTRANTEQPFVATCDLCYEEKRFLDAYPKGKERIENQRIEQLRRSLASTAVIRHASFSKHSGTYKWPLGSVSATHISAHIRSVHARHDKAEAQWLDMTHRFNRTGRPKDRARIRTKELERLLVSIEDSESYTDRHNMLLFLLRDVERKAPVGFEREPTNIFDPASDTLNSVQAADDGERTEITSGDEASETVASTETCVRVGCDHKPRFDSLFCSDACGVSCLEADLMRSFFDAYSIHPSLVRA
jgi:hypothetical protein